MSKINYGKVQKFADTERVAKRVPDILRQSASVVTLCYEGTALPEQTNISATKAVSMIQKIKPSSVAIRNSDAVDCSRWWKKLKRSFRGGKLRKVEFVISGNGNSWEMNMAEIKPVIQEVVSKLASKKPTVFYIRATENSLRITSVSQKKSAGKPEQVVHSFEMKLVGDWNWKYSFAELLADVLPDQFCNLRKVYLVFGFTDNTVVKRVFEEMNWTLPDVHYLAGAFMNTDLADELYFDQYAYTRRRMNEFDLAATKTKVRYFFGERNSNIYENEVTYAGVPGEVFGRV